MAKHTYYFKHDFSAHADEKIIDLRMIHGLEGYGIFWYLIELLAESENYTLENNYKRLAFSIGAKEDTLSSVVEDFGLFIIENGCFHSKSLSERMEKLDSIKEKRAEFGRLGGVAKAKLMLSKPLANAKQTSSKPLANSGRGEERRGEKRKEEDSKEKNIKDIYSLDFKHYWQQWNLFIKNLSNKKTSSRLFEKLSSEEKKILFESIEPYSKTNTNPQYLKRCETYINQKHWEQRDFFIKAKRDLGDF